MPANVETMFSVREVPWHKLGTVIQEAPTSKDALRLAGLDWTVVQKPMTIQDTDEVVKNYKINIRESDGVQLGVVSDRYKVVQNEEAFAFTDNLLGEGVTYETAGSLASGKRVWLLAKLAGTKICGDDYDNYLVFTNSHDGSGAIKVAITPVRVVCQNTLNVALSSASRSWSCVHKGDINSKLEEARETLTNAQSYLDALNFEFNELSTKQLSDQDVTNLTELLFPISDLDEKNPRKLEHKKEQRAELLFRYQKAPDLQEMGKTAYRFINAVSDYATHSDPLRNTKNFEENRFIHTVDGNTLLDKAYSYLTD